MTEKQQGLNKYVRCVLLVIVVLFFSISAYATESFEVHVLDVGQGQAILVEAEGHYMLVDGGGRNASSFVVSYLKQSGIEGLDYIVVSHYDDDHMSGTIGALSVFPCKALLLPSYEGTTDLYPSLAVAAISNGCLIMHPRFGEQFYLGEAKIDIVGPVRTDYTNENNLSLGVHLTYRDTGIIICGDAEQESELDMVKENTDLQADIYIVDHHGSSTSSMDAFLDRIAPSYAIISCGKDNGYGHPSLETMQRLQNHEISMFRTDEQGTIVASSDGEEIWFNIEPSNNWSSGNNIIPLEVSDDGSGNEEVARQMSQEEDLSGEDSEEYKYVCNTNTKKIHYPKCNSVNQMKEENRLYTNLSREELIAQGYEPCGNCHP